MELGFLVVGYFLVVNLMFVVLFILDKSRAKRNLKKRIPEKKLHSLEALGGVFLGIVLMYVMRHKNKKKSYYLKTYLILLIWIIVLTYLFLN